MKTSESIKNIATALQVFHKEVSAIKKTETNPFFKNKYADLTAVLSGIKEPLEKAGLSFTQFPDKNGLTTMLMHTSGEWIKARAEFVLAKQDPQGQGSAITYMRRYALGAVLGLITEDDDDGAKASNNAQNSPQSVPEVVGGDLGRCDKCNAPNRLSKAKKIYCGNRCWLNPTEQTVQVDEPPMPAEPF